MLRKSTVKIMLFIILGISSLVLLPLFGEELPVIRISVENTISHVQTKAVQRFATSLAARLDNRYEVQFFPAAALFSDADVFRALAQGKVEMAVPGTWQFDRYVPQVGLFLLPSMYGRDASFTYGVTESPIGAKIVANIERVLDVKVVGRWIDLGHTHIFTTGEPVRRPSDFVGKRIRVAGGRGNALRIEALGASAVTIPWPDFPAALKAGTVDGVLTSYETLASARLWERGIGAVYEDRQYFAQYVPIVSRHFWDRIPEDVREMIVDTWESVVDQARLDAAIAQASSRALMIRNGMTITIVGDGQLQSTRSVLMESEPRIASVIGIPSDLYQEFSTYVRRNDIPHTVGTR